MMSEERARILRMVANGKLSAEEAAELLEALEPASRTEARSALPAESMPVSSPTGPRTLVINITEGGDSKVNVRIPLGLARAAGRFIPRQAQEYLEDHGIDLKQILSEQITGWAKGPLIEVQDEKDHVLIAVE
jgi:hypothetical protein